MVSPGWIVGTRARRVGLLLVLAVVAIPVVAALAEHLLYGHRVLPNVRVSSFDLSGQRDKPARDAINRLGADLAAAPIRVRIGTQTFRAERSLIGFTVDAGATAAAARHAGRSANPLSAALGTVVRRFRPDRVPLVVHYDRTRFEGLLDGWANATNDGVVEGDLRFAGTEVVPVEPRSGTGLLRREAGARLRSWLVGTNTDEIELPTGSVDPRVDRAAVDAAAARARALLTGARRIVADGTQIELSPSELAPALGTRIDGRMLELTIDADRLADALGDAIAPFDQPAADATFAISPDNTVGIVPSRDGRTLDLAAVAAAILRGERTIHAPVRRVHPAHDTAWARALGITRQVSSFTTSHLSGQPRVHNIHLAADTLNNTVVEPGAEFSLNDTLGPRTPEKGYVSAPILVPDGFGEDYGGGVSQIATTLYNAVFFGGYEDVDHSPHAFYISRYPMGREATLNYPSIDLRFRNDTSHGVLIRTFYSDTSIGISLYGDNDGRTVREENRRVLTEVPVTDELFTCPAKPEIDPDNDCADLTVFERMNVRTGIPGYDVEFDRVIEQPGRPVVRQHYRVHYPMLPNRVLVGITVPSSTTTGTSTTTKPGTKPPPSSTTTTVP